MFKKTIHDEVYRTPSFSQKVIDVENMKPTTFTNLEISNIKDDQPFTKERPSELSARDIMGNKCISKKEVMKHILQSKRRATSPGNNLTSELFEKSGDLNNKIRSGSTTQRMQAKPNALADPVILARTAS